MDKRPDLCIYHDGCFDGFGAAWVVRNFCRIQGREVEMFPAKYTDAPPTYDQVKDREVIIVDFSYDRATIEALHNYAKSLTVIDHHESAQAALAGLPYAIFDMQRSGAGLTWDVLFPNDERPLLISYIEDRDLWKFELPESRAVHSGLASYPFDFDEWTQRINMGAYGIDDLAACGVAIERKHQQDITYVLKMTQRIMKIGDYIMPCANVNYIMPCANVNITMVSDAANRMATEAEENGFPGVAAAYSDTPEGRAFSLRSTPKGPNVSEIAKRYGGGGHARAAGFQMPRGWEGEV